MAATHDKSGYTKNPVNLHDFLQLNNLVIEIGLRSDSRKKLC